ncbi:MAG: hypothetical protein QOJ44_2109, partial [Acidimicrobiaceae bacterium]|nr:hypothetical protein [Acidimicrobiaceae bacterium]
PGGSISAIDPSTNVTSGFQLRAPTSTAVSCTTTFSWNLANNGTYPYGTWTGAAYLDSDDTSSAQISVGIGGVNNKPIPFSANGALASATTTVANGGSALSVPLSGQNALVFTLTAPAGMGYDDVVDISNDTLTLTGQTPPALPALGESTTTTTAATSCSAANAILAGQATALYLLNDPAGTAHDASGHGNNGSIYAASAFNQTPGPIAACPTNGALGFNGSSSFVSAPQGVNAATTGNAMSVVSWFKLASTPSDSPRLISNDHTDQSGNGFQLMLNGGTNGVVSGFFDVGTSGGTGTASWSQQLKVGTWYQYVGTYNGSTVAAYINGQQVATGTTSGNINAGADNVNIGRNPAYDGDYFPGNVADVALVPSAMSSSQIAGLWDAASGTTLAVSAPTNAIAGTPASVTVTALSQVGNTATGYTGSVRLTSSDPKAMLPGEATLTNGTGVFPVTLQTPGSQTVTATDAVAASVTGTSNPISVTAIAPPGPPTGLVGSAQTDGIALSWTAPTATGESPITGYQVLRGTTAGGEGTSPLATVTTTSYVDNSAAPRSVYFYVIKAINSVGSSASSNEEGVMADRGSLAATPDRNGYWVLGPTGSLAAFGSAANYGSADKAHLNAPLVSIAATPDGKGYWLVGADGGVFAFGDATFSGSSAGQHLNAPITGITATPDGKGYWLVGADGGVFAFGDAGFYGSLGSGSNSGQIIGLVITPSGSGYSLIDSSGAAIHFGQ